MLPDPIVEHIRSVVEREYEYADERIHVSELCGCLLKAWFRRRYPVERDFDQLWFLYRGIVYDELWTRLFERNQIRVTHRIRNGPTIVGRYDFYWDDRIWDLKTTISVRNLKEPFSHHVDQVKFYCWCENVDKGALLYVSFDGYQIFYFDCDDAEEVVKRFEEKAIVLYNALEANEPPTTAYTESWECRYCEYALDFCGGKGIGLLKNID